jgi:hypothetical protein
MTGQLVWVVSLMAAACFVGALGFAVWKLRAQGLVDDTGAEERVTEGYYLPMARLLQPDEFSRMSAMGFTPKQVTQLRASRRRAFAAYLSDLQTDFRFLHREARSLVRDSAVDRPDLAMELLKQYASFQYAVLLAYARLAVHSVGMESIDTKALLEPAQWMQQHIELLRTPLPSLS